MGEKIDVVEYSEDTVQFISSSLSPAQVDKVTLNHEENSAEVVVPDRQLSLAIGREGQNARLAAKLTNWHIDIKSSLDVAPVTVEPPEVTEKATEDAVATEETAVTEAADAVATETVEVSETADTEIADEAPAEETVAIEESDVPSTVEKAAEIIDESAASGTSAEEELALLALEEEIKALEAQEVADAERAEQELAAAVNSDDIWQVGGDDSDNGGGLRFAEDIVGYRDMSSGRRSRRGRGGNNLSPKARRAQAKKAAPTSTPDNKS